MIRMVYRMEKTERVLDDLSKFAKKALDQINRFSECSVSNLRRSIEPNDEENTGPSLMYEQVDLMKLGGATHSEQAFCIAKALWTEEERKNICIDPKKSLSKDTDRTPADEERTDLYRKAVELKFGDNFSETLYKATLRLVNQRFREKRNSLQK